MFQKILVAIAGRSPCESSAPAKSWEFPTVAVDSEADRNSLHVRFADEAVCIGPPRSSESYLNIPQVISAGGNHQRGCDSSGYGFLSENANSEGLRSVGDHLHRAEAGSDRDDGREDRARREMKSAGCRPFREVTAWWKAKISLPKKRLASGFR